ncbi:testisin-like [Colossoma macropomum]|uniref:testisin-like n=1 Tax=Colossoma macropomum TaxID=42526 RepID=UPI001864D534|nr:testisin-like [Colossoma macropomum]
MWSFLSRITHNSKALISGLVIILLLVYSNCNLWTKPDSRRITDEGTQERCTWPSRSKACYGQKRIINGKRPQHEKWPWFVRLQNGSAGCGGSLVGDRHVLTAAHCFDDTGPNENDWQVYLGVVNRKEPSKPYKVKEIILHQAYDKDSIVFRNDIALLTLSQPVQFSENIHSVCLPRPDHLFPTGTKCWIAGFGKTMIDSTVPSSSYLMEADVKIVERSECNSQDVHNGSILQSMLCAGDPNGSQDACHGDSGGPLVCEDQEGLWYLAGIISWGVDCGRPNKPGIYTNVSHFSKWIDEKLNNGFLSWVNTSCTVSPCSCVCYLLCFEAMCFLPCACVFVLVLVLRPFPRLPY